MNEKSTTPTSLPRKPVYSARIEQGIQDHYRECCERVGVSHPDLTAEMMKGAIYILNKEQGIETPPELLPRKMADSQNVL